MFKQLLSTLRHHGRPQTISKWAPSRSGKPPAPLVGVVVAGNLDIRGSSYVDGSIIVTGTDARQHDPGLVRSSDAEHRPDGPDARRRLGQESTSAKPSRPLPDGINLAIDITPQPETYVEGKLVLGSYLNCHLGQAFPGNRSENDLSANHQISVVEALG